MSYFPKALIPSPDKSDKWRRLRMNETVAETTPRGIVGGGDLGATSLVSGQLCVTAFPCEKGVIISAGRIYVGAVAGAGIAHAWWLIAGSNFIPQAYSTDNPAMTFGANLERTLPSLTAPWTCPADGLYHFGFCVVATTVPSLRGVSSVSSPIDDAHTPVISGRSNGGLTDPASLQTVIGAGAFTTPSTAGHRHTVRFT